MVDFDTPCRRRLVLGAMAALLLVMPVSYRAGAEMTHPHAVFQLLADAEHGVVHHHHHSTAANHAADTHDEPTETRWTTGHHDGRRASVAVRVAPPDTPTLSPLKAPTPPAVSLLGLVAVMLAAVESAVWRPLWGAARRMSGRLLSPEYPPPRHSLLSAAT